MQILDQHYVSEIVLSSTAKTLFQTSQMPPGKPPRSPLLEEQQEF